MITFFRIKTFFHILSILVILMLLKLPFILSGMPILQTELEWLLVGERLNMGYALYQDIWTAMPPLNAYLHGIIHFFFGRNFYYHELIAIMLVFAQAILLNQIVNSKKVLFENNYLVGVVYVLVLSLSFDSIKLSPMLIGNTFLIMALNSMLSQIESKDGSTQSVFEIGLFIGIGSLFVQTFPLFLIWGVIGVIMFCSPSPNQLILVIIGFLLPVFGFYIYYYFIGNADVAIRQWLGQGYRNSTFSLSDIRPLLLLYIIPIVLAFLGFFQTSAYNRYTSYQFRKQQSIVLLGMVSIVVYFASNEGASYQFLGIAPFLAIFITAFFLHFKNIYLAEVLFVLFVLVVYGLSHAGFNGFLGFRYEHLSELKVKEDATPTYAKDKFILVTGKNNSAYYQAKPGSAYTNYVISEYDLDNPNIYESVVSISENMKKTLPEVIIDNEQVFPAIFTRIPLLSNQYQRIEGTKNYRLK